MTRLSSPSSYREDGGGRFHIYNIISLVAEIQKPIRIKYVSGLVTECQNIDSIHSLKT